MYADNDDRHKVLTTAHMVPWVRRAEKLTYERQQMKSDMNELKTRSTLVIDQFMKTN